MKNRKWTLLLTSTAICLTLAACGASNESASITETAESQVETQTETTQTAESTDTETAETTDTTEATTEVSTETAVEEVLGTYPDGTSPVYSGVKCILTVDGEEVVIAMYDNTAAEAFLERLPLEDLNFYDLSGIEKPVERPEEAFSLGEEEPGYDPVTGEMVIYRPWGNFTIFYGDFRHSDELVPLGKVESGLEILAGKTDDFTGTLEVME